MKKGCGKVFAIAISLAATVALAAIILSAAIPSCAGTLDFPAVFYYVCYGSAKDSQSAASVSGVVHSYGGAGYIIENGGNYYVTVSCYYELSDAQEVADNLQSKGLKCSVVEAKRQKTSLPLTARKKAQSYIGVFDTLLSLSRMCYDLANGMDGGSVDAASAKSVLGEVRTALEGLRRANKAGCFSEELSALEAECDDVSEGYVFSYDVRRLQIAICDSIIHVRLY